MSVNHYESYVVSERVPASTRARVRGTHRLFRASCVKHVPSPLYFYPGTLVMRSLLFRVVAAVPLLSLAGILHPMPSAIAPSAIAPTEHLVADGVVWVDPQSRDEEIMLPVTLHGKPATLLYNWGPGQLPPAVQFFSKEHDLLAHFGIAFVERFQPQSINGGSLPGAAVPDMGTQGAIDSLAIGTFVARHVEAIMWDDSLNFTGPQSLPHIAPVLGTATDRLVADLDMVVARADRHVRFYAPPDGASPATRRALPPGVHWDVCRPTHVVGEGNPGFPIDANGGSVVGVMQNIPFPAMNLAMAKRLGLTKHSPNVQVVPVDKQDSSFTTGPDLYTVTGVQLTFGRYHVTRDTVHILADLPLEESPDTPTIELRTKDLPMTPVLFSHRAKQVCMGTPG